MSASDRRSEGGLRVAVDARGLPTGVSGDRTYLLGILRELVRIAPDVRFLLCYNEGATTGLESEPPLTGVSVHRVPCRPGWLWTPLAWPRLLRTEQADVAHAQYLLPPFSPCPTVVTIHDVSFLSHPEWFPKRSLRVMRLLIPLSARRSTRIITGSAHAAGEIARLCRIRREKIHVIPYAAAPAFRPSDLAVQDVAARYGLDGRYVLAVGLIQPRKNLARLLDAYAQVAVHHHDVRLAIVGRTGWGAEAVHEQVAALGLGERVVFCGAVPDEDLSGLYRAATVFCYPSLYEGFGLPTLEAMQCGTPVVASNTTSLPEVVGDGGILVDPYDVDAIAAGLSAVLGNPDEAARLSRAGIARAAQFSWHKCAAAHLELYRELGS